MLNSLFVDFSLYSALVVLTGYVVFGLTGFGSALVIIPLLSWQWSLSAIVPTVLMLDVLASISHTCMNLKQVRWHVVPKITPFAIFGAWLGMQVNEWRDSLWAIAILGLYICLVAVRGLRRKVIPFEQSGIVANSVAGTLMGLIETLFGTAGPVVMAWLTRQEQKIEDIRATAPLLILIMVCIALICNGLTSQNEIHQVFTKSIWLAPIALMGGWMGHRFNSRISPTTAANVIYSVLLLSGISLIARSFLL